MELHELHVDQLGAGRVGQGVPVAGALPAVAGDAEGAAEAAAGEDQRLALDHVEAAALPVVGDDAGDAPGVEQQRHDGVLHQHRRALVDRVILQRADQLEAGAIADVRETRIAMAAEVALQDAAVRRAIEDGAVALQLADAIRRFLGVQLRHPPVVDVLAAAHRVGEVDLPVVAIVDVAEGRGHAALGHDGVRLAEERLADHADRDAGIRRLDHRPQAGAAGPHDEHVEALRRRGPHQNSLQSVRTPIEQRRT